MINSFKGKAQAYQIYMRFVLALIVLLSTKVLADINRVGANNYHITHSSGSPIVNGQAVTNPINSCVIGNGFQISKEIELTSLATKLIVNGPLVVHVVPGTKSMLKIKADSNLVQFITITQTPETLEMAVTGCITTTSPIVVSLVLPHLDFLVSKGSGFSYVYGIDAPKFSVLSRGSGDIILSGLAPNLEVDTRGSGDLFLTNLRVQNANVLMKGSGDLHAFISDTLDVRLMGSGSIYLASKINRVNKELRGSGRVIGPGRI